MLPVAQAGYAEVCLRIIAGPVLVRMLAARPAVAVHPGSAASCPGAWCTKMCNCAFLEHPRWAWLQALAPFKSLEGNSRPGAVVSYSTIGGQAWNSDLRCQEPQVWRPPMHFGLAHAKPTSTQPYQPRPACTTMTQSTDFHSWSGSCILDARYFNQPVWLAPAH